MVHLSLSLDYQPAQSMNVAEVDLTCRAFDIVGRGCHLALGFGVDPITDDYKIVMISNSQTDPLVYSPKADTWSLINSPTVPLKNVMSRACLVDETLYWVVEFKQTGICIMTFNLSTHVCGTIEFHGPRCETRKLMVVKDSLAVLYTTSSNYWIWVRRERNNSTCWSKVVRSITWSFDQRVGRVLELTDGDFLLHKYELGLTVYNPERGDSPFPSSYISDIIDMETYAESLALLDRGVVCKGNQQSCDIEAKTNGRNRKRKIHKY
uniref:uncharacterized protein LOC122605537 n=1 Tax=Erigeron canadensis TaxID=72917 RepID=UPI001CB8E3FD|nr:uncharacterized protein LOC122605537 [Erigeron canadensis]